MVKIVVCVTGFGPFRGQPNNPTSILCEEFPKYLVDNPLKYDDDDTTSVEVAHCCILETSAEMSRVKLLEIMQQVDSETCVIFLHLGVYDGAQTFRLERRAFNEATFRCADERGFTPHREPIIEGINNICHTFNTPIAVESVCNELCTRGHSVVVSDDAGRFVCNWIYANSLHECSKRASWYSLFLHVPAFRTVPLAVQVPFVHECAQVLVEDVARKLQVTAKE